ncbi:ATP-dependent endonuclease [Bacteroidia bacterium]|nr:ATP-dependent endonuclease [Bacteroidia bacterium]
MANFLEHIKANFPFEPTPEQQQALEEINTFLFDKNSDSIFLLKGYAGTGKSSLVGALVQTMTELNQKSVLLAPTGRAAKVFAGYAHHKAYTIHKKIYRQRAFSNDPTGVTLNFNAHVHTLFIVDEASMISSLPPSPTPALPSGEGVSLPPTPSTGGGAAPSPEGRAGVGLAPSPVGRAGVGLLDDLIHYVYSGQGCRLILLGDSAQLPPVSQVESPALDPDFLAGYNLRVHTLTLTQVVRQTKMSGILYNATLLRKAIEKGTVNVFPKIKTKNFSDVQIIKGDELLEAIENAYQRNGMEETIIISRSNKRANLFNNGIRNRILWREEELSSGDLLLVAKNNYFWAKDIQEMDFIANGDIMEVKRIHRTQELYGFRFCDVTVYFSDYNVEMDMKILLESLHSDAPSLSKEQSDQLFQAILADYAHLTTQKERMQALKIDPFYNVVQVKYAYAITCHKAQGGQWKNVFLDISYVPEDYLGVDFYRWLYTAFTRPTEKLYLVNPAKDLLA